MLYEVITLNLRDEGAVDALQHPASRRDEKHIAVTQKRLGAHRIEDGA